MGDIFDFCQNFWYNYYTKEGGRMPNYMDDFVTEITAEEFYNETLLYEAERNFLEEIGVEVECYDD